MHAIGVSKRAITWFLELVVQESKRSREQPGVRHQYFDPTIRNRQQLIYPLSTKVKPWAESDLTLQSKGLN